MIIEFRHFNQDWKLVLLPDYSYDVYIDGKWLRCVDLSSESWYDFSDIQSQLRESGIEFTTRTQYTADEIGY